MSTTVLILLATVPGGCVGFALRGWVDARAVLREARSVPTGQEASE